MGQDSKIEWTDHTFNPWRGCTMVSPGCANCYAETLSHRNPGTLGVWGPNGTRVVASESMWREPLKWNKAAACVCYPGLGVGHMEAFTYCPQHSPDKTRPRVFCASLADVFEGPETMPASEWPKVRAARVRLFHLISGTPNLDWLVLTKRPENVTRFCVEERSWSESPPPNLWLGTSVESQQAADERVPRLLRVPAAVRFLSCEPLLGPVNLSGWMRYSCRHCKSTMTNKPPGYDDPTAATSTPDKPVATWGWSCSSGHFDWNPPGIHWCIIGGESGPGAREMRLEWARSLVGQCKAASVPVFVKQLGALAETDDDRDALHSKHPTRFALNTVLFRDKKGGDIEEWPHDLRVREFPGQGSGSSQTSGCQPER